MKSVFISRDLAPNSAFKQILEAEGVLVEGYSLIDFEAVDFNTVPVTDWIFFYSKKAVHYFFEGLDKIEPKPNLNQVKYACMGEGTAKQANKYINKISFVGEGSPEKVAKSFLKVAKNQSVLFPRAKNSKKSIQKIIGSYILSSDLIVYNNKPKTDFTMVSRHLLVFTSPLNAEAYFNKHQLQANQKIVAIGETTASTLRSMGYCEISISLKHNERALANTTMNLLN